MSCNEFNYLNNEGLSYGMPPFQSNEYKANSDVKHLAKPVKISAFEQSALKNYHHFRAQCYLMKSLFYKNVLSNHGKAHKYELKANHEILHEMKVSSRESIANLFKDDFLMTSANMAVEFKTYKEGIRQFSPDYKYYENDGLNKIEILREGLCEAMCMDFGKKILDSDILNSSDNFENNLVALAKQYEKGVESKDIIKAMYMGRISSKQEKGEAEVSAASAPLEEILKEILKEFDVEKHTNRTIGSALDLIKNSPSKETLQSIAIAKELDVHLMVSKFDKSFNIQGDGIYRLVVDFDAGLHAILIVKNGENQYVWDPNYGLIRSCNLKETLVSLCGLYNKTKDGNGLNSYNPTLSKIEKKSLRE